MIVNVTFTDFQILLICYIRGLAIGHVNIPIYVEKPKVSSAMREFRNTENHASLSTGTGISICLFICRQPTG